MVFDINLRECETYPTKNKKWKGGGSMSSEWFVLISLDLGGVRNSYSGGVAMANDGL